MVPLENSIFGSVIETYDLLRLPEVGRDKVVRGEISHDVQHCLLVNQGVKIHQITRVLSHEQVGYRSYLVFLLTDVIFGEALGQCRRFIAEKLPNASVESTSSTSAAAQMTHGSSECAAICSRLCATLFQGLEVLYEGIQDENGFFFSTFLITYFVKLTLDPPSPTVNATRFYILTTTDPHVKIPLPPRTTSPKRALIRISWDPATLLDISITQLLIVLGLRASRLDRRPSLHHVIFHDVYFVELEQESSPETADEGTEIWIAEVKRAVERVNDFGGEACLLGTWSP